MPDTKQATGNPCVRCQFLYMIETYVICTALTNTGYGRVISYLDYSMIMGRYLFPVSSELRIPFNDFSDI